MKSWLKDFKTLTIIGLIIVIFLLRECRGEKSPIPTEPVTIVKIETKYDTIVETVPTYIPKYKTKVKIKTVHDTIRIHDTIPVDTAAILKDYFTTYAYTDTLKKDSVTFVINDTISQNKILSRGIKYNLIYPTTTITTEREVNKRELYIGFGLGGDRQQLSYIGSELLLRNKKDKIYGIGLGINNNFRPVLTFKMNWKVKLPKFKKLKIQIPIESLL